MLERSSLAELLTFDSIFQTKEDRAGDGCRGGGAWPGDGGAEDEEDAAHDDIKVGERGRIMI